ncbi:MAG: lamin tail domain-containing protein, partial [Bacteroidia bacterium]|nr:lamin tail domain-containing protein [Bacteroidia bacterium]
MRVAWLIGCLLYAQLSDDFSDGDFTTNPTWSGTDAYWLITPDFRLRSNGPAANATLYLSTPNALIQQTEWQFWVRVGFNPSSSNFVRVYLVADRADLTDAALNGYYLRLGGITGSSDSLELWRQQGSVHTRLGGGRPGRFGGTNNILRVRILRDQGGTWTVYTDSSGYWELEFSVTDAVITTTSYFGVYFRHTSTNRQNLWFDDFYIGAPQVDTIPPQLNRVEVLSPTTLRLTFSEAITLSSAQNPANYILSPGSWTIVSAIRTTPSTVELTLSAALPPSVPYTLSFSGIEDMAGNIGSGSSFVVLPEEPERGDLIFSEIMAKPTPAVGLPPYEYIELYNRSSKWLQVSGVRFCDGLQCGTLPARVLPPQGYLLLVPSGGSSAYPSAVVPSAWPTLNDNGDSLTLLNGADEILEEIEYRSTWYRDPSKANGGWSLERIDLNDLCNADSNWIASAHASGGTPGAPNSTSGLWTDQTPPHLLGWAIESSTQLRLTFSERLDTLAMSQLSNYTLTGGNSIAAIQAGDYEVRVSFSSALQRGTTYTLAFSAIDCKGNARSISLAFGLPEPAERGDIVISEIMAKPTPTVGLPPYEYVELYNRSSKWIALGGWQFCDTRGCVVLPERVIAPGGYVVLTSSAGALALPQAVGVSGFPTLNDSGDSLRLLRIDGAVMEKVSYKSSWYRDPSKAAGGWSLERIDLNDLCSADSNWIACIHPSGGTPGGPNSVAGIWRDQTPPSLQSIRFRSAQEILLTFSEALDTAFMGLPERYTISGGVSVQGVSLGEPNEVVLHLSAPLLLSADYLLEIDAQDCVGNRVRLQQAFGLPSPPAAFDIVITEIMTDPEPPVGLPPYEYVEIYNRSQKYLELGGWSLRVGNVTKQLPSFLFRPGGYLTLSSVEGAVALAPYGSSLGIGGFPSLPNRGGTIALLSPSGEIIDRVSYSDDWYDDPAKDEGGWSLERIWTEWLCGGKEGWQVSRSPVGGTPSAPNSVRRTDAPPPVRISSVRYEPPVVILTFSERMDSNLLSRVESYRWEPPVPLIAATPTAEGFAVELLPMVPLEENRTYRVSLHSATTCAGASVDSLGIELVVPAQVEPLDVVVNEILPEPHPGSVRYIELYNRSAKIIDASQLLLARGSSARSFQRISGEEPVLLRPRNYLCLAPDTEEVQRRYLPPSHARFYQVRALPAYDYGRDTVWLLRGRDSVPIDWVPYTSSYHFPDLRSRKGVALERLSPHKPSQLPDNWYSAASTVRYGTPGYENSQREPGGGGWGVRIEPRTFSPDGDGYDDVLWIYVPVDSPGVKADITVLTLSGHEVAKVAESHLLAVGENSFRWEGVDKEGRRLPAGIYIVYVVLVRPEGGKVERYRLPCGIAERV